MSTDAIQLANQAANALLNGTVQGLVLTAAVGLGLKFTPRTNATTRHAVWLLTLFAVLALPILHFAAGGGVPPKAALEAHKAAGGVTTAFDVFPEVGSRLRQSESPANGSADFNMTTEASTGEGRASVLASPDLGGGRSSMGSRGRSPSPGVFRRASPEPIDEHATSAASLASSARVEDARRRVAGERRFPFLGPESAWLSRSLCLPIPPRLTNWLLAAVGALGLLRLSALGWQLRTLRRLKERSDLASEPVQSRFRDLLVHSAATRAAQLRIAAGDHSPMVVGFWPPVIVIPGRLVEQLSPTELDLILRHELAHVQRYDDWANLAQQSAKALFSFHPGVLWICRTLTMEREIACDDWVLQAGPKRRDYASFLTEFASRRPGRNWTAAPAGWCHKPQLVKRIDMILKTDRNLSLGLARASFGVLTATATGLGLLLLLTAPRLSLADEPTTQGQPEQPTSPTPAPAPVPVAGGPALALPRSPAASATTPMPAPVQPPPGGMATADEESIPAPPAPGAPALTPPVAPPPPVGIAPLPIAQNPPAPQPGMMGAYPGNGAGRRSLEQRMDRVEGMLESILRQLQRTYPGSPGAGADLRGRPDPMPRDEYRPRSSNRNSDEPRRPDNQYSPQTGARTRPNAAPAPISRSPDSLERRMEALEQQRAALQRQLENVERELGRLEQDLKGAKERLPGAEMNNELPRPEPSTGLPPDTRLPEGR
jgi:beta-lactamase regulating signal transducer with metallopeptidase domain